MMHVDELLKYYPESQRGFREFILREYLQFKILQIIFDHPAHGKQLCFLGGTCLRIVHGNTRFSEDIDFDNVGLVEKDFEKIADTIKQQLEREGYEIEIKTVYKGAFHCYIRFPSLLYQQGLTGHQEQKILIQLDTEPQHYTFTPEKFIINKFDVFTEITVTPINILLAQKLYTIINRKRSKGRDFFDVIFLLGKGAKPDYQYLKIKLNINTSEALKDRVLQTCDKLDMNEMARDVSPFLFDVADARKVAMFVQYLKQVDL
ncbi:MAG: nucleotidyl transferase AbiEii/AbiGii toxin family protein [Cyclobacteriaceae bacterium]